MVSSRSRRSTAMIAAVAVAVATIGSLAPAEAGRQPVTAAAADEPRRPIDDPALRAEVIDAVAEHEGTGPLLFDVEVLHDGADEAVAARVVELGGTVTGQAPGTVVQAKVPLAAITALAASPGVTYVRDPINVSVQPESAGLPMAATTSEAVAIMQAAAWHGAGHTGTGVRVGIIDFFNGSKWTTQQAAGEVPAPAGTICLDLGVSCSIWDDDNGHGNAVAETIYDLAPGVQLYLATPGSIADYYRVVDWFVANGVRIVNRSLGSPYDGPGDGTGPLDALADYATARGITWFNSAGNEGEEQYWRGQWADANGNGWLEFAPGDETLDIIKPPSCTVTLLGVRWNDWGIDATRTNYDAFIYSGDTPVWPLGNGPNQQFGAPPIELAGLTGCDARPLSIKIRRLAIGSGLDDTLEVLLYQGALEHWQKAGSAGGPIVDSRNPAVVAVGAIQPAGGGTIAGYSSQGPTNDGRIKPDVSAPSCFSNTIYAAFGQCFNGTSASSPAAAGAAALVLGANLATEPAALAAMVKHLVVDRGPPGPDPAYGAGEVRLPSPPSGPVNASPSAFTAITPVRLYDSRTARTAPHPAHDVVDLTVAGWNGIPATATAVALNVTLTEATGAGYVQVLPTLRPSLGRSANLNIEQAAQTLPNFAITPIGEGGKVSVYSPGGGHLVVDVLGYFQPSGAVGAGRYVPLVPHRVLDTRESVNTDPTVLPVGWSDHKPGIAETISLDFKDVSGLPASGVSAVVLNLVGTEPSLPGFVTAFPSDVGRPNTANLNLTPGSTNANTVIVRLGADRRINLFTQAGTHLVADLAGYVTDGSAPAATTGLFVPLGPDRLMDTRVWPDTAFAGQATRTIAVGGRIGVPPDAVAASFNFAATRTVWSGYLQVWPAGSTPSGLFANLNWSRPGQTISGASIVKLGAGGSVNARVLTGTDLVFDVNGYFTP